MVVVVLFVFYTEFFDFQTVELILILISLFIGDCLLFCLLLFCVWVLTHIFGMLMSHDFQYREVPFYVAVDRKFNNVVISIRGTLSLQVKDTNLVVIWECF